MLGSGSFAPACLQAIVKGVLDPRLPWADTCPPRASTTRRPSHVLKTVKGLLLLVPPRTPRRSGYDFLCTCGLCCYMLYVYYMFYACYMSSSEPSSGSSGSVWIYRGPYLVSRTGCARERHVPCIEGPFLVNRTGHAPERHAP
jgi:hypothetical protein